MAQSVNKVVNVDITISPKAVPTSGFGTLCIFGDSDVIPLSERYRTYTNLNEVVSDFGLESEEYKAAELYFSQEPSPDNLMISRWNRYGAPAQLVGGYLTDDDKNIERWQRITNGSLSFDLNGKNVDILNLDFSKQTNLNGVAEVINQKLEGANIKWDGEKFVLSTDEVGADKTLSYMFFTDKQENIHRMLGLASDQATRIQGTDYIPAIPEQPATSGYLTGTDISPSIESLKTIKNGSFKVTVNDIEIPVNNLNFTSAQGLGDDKALEEIAKVLDRALKPAAIASAADGRITITSNSVGENSIVENATYGDSYPVSAGYLEGTELSGSGTLAELQKITDGSFTINIDGESVSVMDLDFSDDRTFQEVASTIGEKLQGHATVKYDGDNLVITSNTIGTDSKVLRATEGDIKGVKPGYLTGTSLSGTTALNNIKEVTNGSLRLPIDNDTITLNNLDFSKANTLDAVANVLSIALSGRASAKIEGDQIVITSNTLGSKSKVLQALPGEKYEIGGTNGYLTGTTVVSGTISTLQSVENGSFKIQIDGVERAVNDVDLSDAESMNDIAQIIQDKLSLYATVEYSGDHFVVTSKKTGTQSTVSKATEGEVYAAIDASSGYLTGTGLTSKLDALKEVTNGSFNISIDGRLVEIRDLDFSNIQNIQDVVDILYDHLNEQALVSFTGDQLVITSKTTGRASIVSKATEGELIEVGQTSGYLTGTQVDSEQLSAIKAVTDGSMKIMVDGNNKSLTGLDFSSAVDMGGVAMVLDNALSGSADVVYSGDHFVVTSITTGESSTVAPATEGEQIVVGGTQGYLTSADLTIADNLQNIRQIDKGTMKIQIDDKLLNLKALDFSQVATLDDVANVLRPKIETYATVECLSGSGDTFNLKITSLTSGSSSIVGYATEGEPVYEESPAKLTSAEITESGTAAYLSALQAVKNGNFKIDIDGETVSVTALDFSSCETLDDVATVVGEKLEGIATTAIEPAGTSSYLTITTVSTGPESTIAKATTGAGEVLPKPAEIYSASDLSLEAFKAVTNGALYLNLDANTSNIDGYFRKTFINPGDVCLTGLNFSEVTSFADVAEILNSKAEGYASISYDEKKRRFAFRSTGIQSEGSWGARWGGNTAYKKKISTGAITLGRDPKYTFLGARKTQLISGKKIEDPQSLLEKLKTLSAIYCSTISAYPLETTRCDKFVPYWRSDHKKIDLSTIDSLDDIKNKFSAVIPKNRTHPNDGAGTVNSPFNGLMWKDDHFVLSSANWTTTYEPDASSYGWYGYIIFTAPLTLGFLGSDTNIGTYSTSLSGYTNLTLPELKATNAWVTKTGDIYITINGTERTRITLPALNQANLSNVDGGDGDGILDVAAQINLGLKAAGITDRVIASEYRDIGTSLISSKTGIGSNLVIELPEDDDTFADLVSTLQAGTAVTASVDAPELCLDIWSLLGFDEPAYNYDDTDINPLFKFETSSSIEGTIAAKNNLNTLLGIGTTATIEQGTSSDEPTIDNQLYLRLGLNEGSAEQVQGQDILNNYNVHQLLGLDDGTPTDGDVQYNDNQLHIKLGLSDGTETPGEDAVLCDNQLHMKLGLANGTPTTGQPIYNVTDLNERLGLDDGIETPGEDNDNQLHTKLCLANGTETPGKNNDNNLHILLGLVYGNSVPGHDVIPEIPEVPATPGKIISGPVDIEALSQVVDGNFTITIDDEYQNDIYKVNLAGVSTVSGVADILNSRIKGASVSAGGASGAVARIAADGDRLIITSNTTGSGSSVSFADGLDLRGFGVEELLEMTEPLATSLVSGIDPESPVDTVSVMASTTADWYAGVIVSADMPSDDELLEVARFIESQEETAHIFGVTITDKRILQREYKQDLASRCQELGLNRTVAMYSSNSPYAICAFLGRAFVVNFNGVNTTITMMFKQAKLVVAEDLTNTQAEVLKEKRCNVFITYQNGTAIIQYGVMTGDYYFDERHGADWLRNFIQTELYNLLYTSTTKIPQTDDGMNLIVTVINNCLDQAQRNGLIGNGTWLGYEFGTLKRGDVLPSGYYVYAPAMATQTQADRDQRISVPIQIAAKLQGAIHQIDVGITLNR